jgi:hypothetical protein
MFTVDVLLRPGWFVGLGAVVVAVGVGLGVGLPTQARAEFSGAMYQQYRLSEQASSPLAKADCQACHLEPRGGPPWNNFGYAVGFWRGQKQNVRQALASALRLGGDSDKDFYPDLLETFAGSNPQNRDDKPKAKLTELRDQFEATFATDPQRPLPDSDGDGYPDALEVFVGTLPGAATSTPSEPLAGLRARFEQAGGLGRYR